MAPTAASVHKLVAQNARLAKAVWRSALRAVHNRLPDAGKSSSPQLQSLLARATPRHSIHPAAFLKQSKGRWYTTHNLISAAARQYSSSANNSQAGRNALRSNFSRTRIGAAVGQLTGRTPFASTLRPNLTGGTLGRTAGGYSYGGGSARYFSHSPAASAQVVQNVSQAVRAFFISGQKVQYDGINSRNGERRFKGVSVLEDQVCRKTQSLPRATPGSYINFNINPTVTALIPSSGVCSTFAEQTLGTEGLVDLLSVDFARSLRELGAVLDCIKRLTVLGDLPISYHHDCVRIHFPGCDADTVERLCNELGIYRGMIYEDEEFDSFMGTEMALLFPFAPSKSPSEHSYLSKPVSGRQIPPERIDWQNMLSPEQIAKTDTSASSEDGLDYEDVDNPWLSHSPSGYESVHSSEAEDLGIYSGTTGRNTALEYEGLEGIHRFMGHYDALKR